MNKTQENNIQNYKDARDVSDSDYLEDSSFCCFCSLSNLELPY